MLKRSLRLACLQLATFALASSALAQSQGITAITAPTQPNVQVSNSSAVALNNSNQVVGTAFGSLVDPNNPRNTQRWSQAYMWDGTYHALPMIGNQTVATGINNNGDIIGTFVGTDFQSHVARFTTGTITDLNLFGNTGPINNLGHFLFKASNGTPSPSSPFAVTPGATYIVDINTMQPVRQLTFAAQVLNDNDDAAGGNGIQAFVDFGGGAIDVASLLPAPLSGYVYDSVAVSALGPNHQFAGSAEASVPVKGGAFYRFSYYHDPIAGTTVFPQYPTQINAFNSLGDYAGDYYWHNGQQTSISDVVGPGPWFVSGASCLNDNGAMVFFGSDGEKSLFNTYALFDPSQQVNYDPVITIQGGGTFDYDGRPHGATATATGYQFAQLSPDPTITYIPGGSDAPVQPGTYQVTASYPGSPHYNSGSATTTIIIRSTQAPTQVDVVGGTFTYDGGAHAATATVIDSGTSQPVPSATATITYSPGGSTPPTFPGTYQVTATYDGDGSHLGSTGTGTITIGNASLVVNVANTTMALNGSVPALAGTMTGMVPGDGLSAVYTTTATSSSPIGAYPINASVSDPLGRLEYYDVTINPGTLSITFAGNTGALQPINADGTSVFKQGSTVTVKFQVFDANGASVGTPGVVTSFYIVQIVSGTVTQTVNEPVSTNNPDSAFRWDATAQQWIFNISTKGLAAGNTYYFQVTLSDGSTINFHFGLK